MIKKIQLRGLSRTPSDRMSADGGLAECINLQLEDTELTPIIEPVECQSGLFPKTSDEINFRGLYIHTTSNYKIGIVRAWPDGFDSLCSYENGELVPFYRLKSGETVTAVTSIGNTLIFSLGIRMAYFLRSDGKYSFLGNAIPLPKLRILPKPDDATYAQRAVTLRYNIPSDADRQSYSDMFRFLVNYWERPGTVLNNGLLQSAGTKSAYEMCAEIGAEIWNAVDTLIASRAAYARPMLTKFSLVLYDGTEISSDAFYTTLHSTDKVANVSAVTNLHNNLGYDEATGTTITVELKQLFHLQIMKTLDTSGLLALKNEWKDIVKYVNVYASLDLAYPRPETISQVRVTNRSQTSTDATCDMILERKGVDISDLISETGNYYLLKQFTVQELIDNESLDLPYYNNTDRSVRPLLDMNIVQPRNQIVGKKLYAYNSRLLMSGIDLTWNSGSNIYHGITTASEGVPFSMRWHYFIRNESGETSIVRGDNLTMEGTFARPLSYVCYPSANCFKAILETSPNGSSELKYYVVDMKESIADNMSFFMEDGEKPLFTNNGEVNPEITGIRQVDKSELYDGNQLKGSPTVHYNNKLYISKGSNMFIFDTVRTLTGDIIGFASATRALSTGQFGQYPLYIFCKDGVWSQEILSDGGFGRCVPMSREVCINPKTICNMDQSVAFMATRGLMVITGGDIRCISEVLNGKSYFPERDLVRTVGQQKVVTFLGDERKHGYGRMYENFDEASFLTFMEDATVVFEPMYDRLICIGVGVPYQYVYMIKTNSWHKSQAFGFNPLNVLNSYENCLVYGTTHSEMTPCVVDYSKVISPDAVTEDDAVKCVIVTRPLDLDMPDIRKVVKSIRMRGQFAKTRKWTNTDSSPELETLPSVEYVLLGSMDGNNYGILPSLRGGSYKFFRLVIVCNLLPYERISWIDIDFEPRFDKKLR